MWFAEKFSLNLVEKNGKIFFARKGGEKLWWVLVVVPYIFSNQKSFKIFQMTHKAIIPILKICLNIRIAFCFAEASNEMCFWLCGCFQKFYRSFKTAKRSYLINSCTSEVKKLPLFSVFGHVLLVCIKRVTQICSIDGILVQYGPWKSFSGLEMPFR